MTDDNGWKPVRRGDVYCSPRCGCRCLHTGYERAVKESTELAERMGEGWEAHVWENGGWHGKVQKGVAEITQRTTGSKSSGTYDVTGYTAWINGSKQFIASADAPEDALGFALQDARSFLLKFSAELSDLS